MSMSTPSIETSESKKDGRKDEALVESGLERGLDGENETGDGVFGNEGDVNYNNVGWVSTSVLLAKAQVGLGVLSIPSVFQSLGIVPGVLVLLGLGGFMTYSQVVLGRMKMKYPQIYSIADAFKLMFGPVAGEIAGACMWLFMTMVSGSAFIGLSTAFNAISEHGACTAVFVAVSAIIGFLFSSIRTLGKVKWIGWAGLISLVVAILLVMIAVAAGGRPADAPQAPLPENLEIVIWGKPTVSEAFNAVSNLVFSFAGAPAFLPIQAEMKDPRKFTRAVLCCQAFVTSFYLVVGIVVYHSAGQYVASPALGTAGPLIKKIAYGISIPGLLAAAVIYTHLPAKYIFVRALRNSRHLTTSTATHWIVWLSCTFGCTVFAYIIASAIPVFGGLVGLVGALLGTALCMQAESIMWAYMNKAGFKDRLSRTTKWCLLAALNGFIFCAGCVILVGGTYGSIISIKDGYEANGGTAFSCADNSNSS
ncbi:hypothetical protein JCM8097_002808 [Rhodosporidiobolus ruineniae]